MSVEDEPTKRLTLGTITVSVRGPRAREIAESIRVDHAAVRIVDTRRADEGDVYALTYTVEYRT